MKNLKNKLYSKNYRREHWPISFPIIEKVDDKIYWQVDGKISEKVLNRLTSAIDEES